MVARAQPSAPFASRELNGEVLLEELAELRRGNVHARHLGDLVAGLRGLDDARIDAAQARLRQLAQSRFAGQPAVAALLTRWTKKLKAAPDVPLLVAHFERLALTAALVPALVRAQDRLPEGPR